MRLVDPFTDPVINEVIDKARNGLLTAEDFDPYSDYLQRPERWHQQYTETDFKTRLDRDLFSTILRDRYVREVSWAVYTTEYLQTLVTLTTGKKVLEVCAGNGVLQPLMRARGIDWTSTDAKPNKNRVWVRPLSVHLALSKIPCDIIFVSWVPLRSDLDMQIAKHHKPTIIVGEHSGGCTGSERFWHEFNDEVKSLPRNMADVAQFWGIHDSTSLLWWPTGDR